MNNIRIKQHIRKPVLYFDPLFKLVWFLEENTV
jgi:hypothetical protein